MSKNNVAFHESYERLLLLSLKQRISVLLFQELLGNENRSCDKTPSSVPKRIWILFSWTRKKSFDASTENEGANAQFFVLPCFFRLRTRQVITTLHTAYTGRTSTFFARDVSLRRCEKRAPHHSTEFLVVSSCASLGREKAFPFFGCISIAAISAKTIFRYKLEKTPESNTTQKAVHYLCQSFFYRNFELERPENNERI